MYLRLTVLGQKQQQKQNLSKKAKLLLHVTGKSKLCQFQIAGIAGSRVSSCVLWVVFLSLFLVRSDSDYFTLAFTADRLSPRGKMTLAASTHMLPIEQPQMNEGFKKIDLGENSPGRLLLVYLRSHAC